MVMPLKQNNNNNNRSTGYAAVVFFIFYVYNVLEVFIDSLVPQARLR